MVPWIDDGGFKLYEVLKSLLQHLHESWAFQLRFLLLSDQQATPPTLLPEFHDPGYLCSHAILHYLATTRNVADGQWWPPMIFSFIAASLQYYVSVTAILMYQIGINKIFNIFLTRVQFLAPRRSKETCSCWCSHKKSHQAAHLSIIVLSIPSNRDDPTKYILLHKFIKQSPTSDIHTR